MPDVSTPEQPPPPVAIGKALERTEDDLDRLAEVTEADITAGTASWRAHAPRKYKRLADAVREDEEVKPDG